MHDQQPIISLLSKYVSRWSLCICYSDSKACSCDDSLFHSNKPMWKSELNVNGNIEKIRGYWWYHHSKDYICSQKILVKANLETWEKCFNEKDKDVPEKVTLQKPPCKTGPWKYSMIPKGPNLTLGLFFYDLWSNNFFFHFLHFYSIARRRQSRSRSRRVPVVYTS